MEIQAFFERYPKVAVAFSGGVDSAFLLYLAKKHGAKARAYYVDTAFQPAFEKEDAQRFAEEIGASFRVIPVDILSCSEVLQNGADRCYHCKKRLFSALIRAAEEDGFSVLLDGTNASDDAADRPGMRALKELSVLSPLRICGYTKDRIRDQSRKAGLFTWDKPAYACLATRIRTGEAITGEKLQSTEKAEAFLFSLGFRDLRVRLVGRDARIQVPVGEMQRILEHREEILSHLKKDYSGVFLDMEGRG